MLITTCIEMSLRGASCYFHIIFKNAQLYLSTSEKKQFKTFCKVENFILCYGIDWAAGHCSLPTPQEVVD